jgi:hypothetical protein
MELLVDSATRRECMASAFISKLPKDERQALLDDLNYLNIAEIKSFCKRHSVPYRIAMETKDGRRKVTRDDDRKGVILNRIRHFLQTGAILKETCFPAAVVCFDQPSDHITADDRLFYGQYDKTSRTMITLLKSLTDGKFENGAIARMLARDFWSRGKAPTFREYASAWIRASREHLRPNPEWAFLSDRASKGAVPDWAKLRKQKAAKVMKVLDQITCR